MSRFFALFGAVFLVSTAALFAHRALAEVTPLALAAWRLGFASLFFLAWSRIVPVGQEKASPAAPLPRPAQARLILAGVCLALHFLTWFASLQYIPIARSTLLVCTTPLWTALGSLLLRRRTLTTAYWPALLLATAGIGLVTQTVAQAETRLALWGDTLATCGGAMFAVYLLSVEGLHETIPARRQVTVAYSVAAAALWLALLLTGKPVSAALTPGVWEAIAGMTLGPQIIGHTLLNWSLRHFPSSLVASSTLLEPVIAALLAWWLFHQTVTVGQLLGGLLVLAGLAVVIAQRKPSDQPPRLPHEV